MSLSVPPARITLPDPWPARIAGGIPKIDAAELAIDWSQYADASSLVLAPADGPMLAYGIIDAANQCVRNWPAAPDEPLDESFFHRRLGRALRLRRDAGLVEPNSACRLVHDAGDGLSGFLVDKYGKFAVIYSFTPAFLPYARSLATALLSELRLEGVLFKVRPLGEPPRGRIPFEVLAGQEPPGRIEIAEHGARYEVHLAGGLNTGFFADMREARWAVASWSKGRHVLNTFAYTGSFSVVAALSGARSVTTVDFAGGALQWAMANFRLNGLATDSPKTRFVRADVLDYLRAERRKDKRWDLIVLDPPAATGVPGRRWYLRSDYDRLIARALKVLAPDGLLLVSASSQGSRPEGIEAQIRGGAREAGRRLRLLDSWGPPVDFPAPIIAPQMRHLKCFLLQAE